MSTGPVYLPGREKPLTPLEARLVAEARKVQGIVERRRMDRR